LRARYGRRIYAIKGVPGPKPIWPRKESRSKKNAGAMFMVGVDTAKDAIYGRLTIVRPGPGRIHFPVGAPFDQHYFDQLTSEQVQTKIKDGRPLRVWILPKGRNNEALDTFVYALAARHSLRVRLDKPLAEAPAAAIPSPPPLPPVEEVETGPAPARHSLATETQQQQTAAPSAPRHSLYQERGSWMGDRRRGWFDRE
jgi:phage terminase large subunit GpA-like protein